MLYDAFQWAKNPSALTNGGYGPPSNKWFLRFTTNGISINSTVFFCRAHDRNQQIGKLTQRDTDRQCFSIYNSRPHLARWSRKIFKSFESVPSDIILCSAQQKVSNQIKSNNYLTASGDCMQIEIWCIQYHAFSQKFETSYPIPSFIFSSNYGLCGIFLPNHPSPSKQVILTPENIGDCICIRDP